MVNHAGGSGKSDNVMPLPFAFGPRIPPWMKPLLPTVPFAPQREAKGGGLTANLEHALESSMGMQAFGPSSGHYPTQVLSLHSPPPSPPL